MTLVSPKLTEAAWNLVPGPLRRKLRTEGGRRLVRFAPAAVLALCATQLTYLICQLAGVTAGIAGAAGWFAGAAVSYVVSRWAWERRGKPHLLKETLPFVVISLCVGVVLTATSKFGANEARALGLHGAEAVVFKQGLYLAANCVTFAVRFLIFHYVLFADRGSRSAVRGSGEGPDGAGPVPAVATPSVSGSTVSGRTEDPRDRR